MSGIVGGINLRSSGLVNNSSAADGALLTGTGVGLPAGFEAAAGGAAGLTKIDSTTITGAVAVAYDSSDITSDYSHYLIVGEGVGVASDNDVMGVQGSVDNGSSFPTHVFMNLWGGPHSNSAPSTAWEGNLAYLQLAGGIESDVGGGGTSFTVEIFNTTSTAEYKYMMYESFDKNANGYWYKHTGGGMIQSTTALNYVKVYNVTGNNLDSGKVTLYGVAP
jgi:hypothetical protein